MDIIIKLEFIQKRYALHTFKAEMRKERHSAASYL